MNELTWAGGLAQRVSNVGARTNRSWILAVLRELLVGTVAGNPPCPGNWGATSSTGAYPTARASDRWGAGSSSYGRRKTGNGEALGPSNHGRCKLAGPTGATPKKQRWWRRIRNGGLRNEGSQKQSGQRKRNHWGTETDFCNALFGCVSGMIKSGEGTLTLRPQRATAPRLSGHPGGLASIETILRRSGRSLYEPCRWR